MFSRSAANKPEQVSALLTPEERQEFEGYEFPFENIAFEGGGSKSMSYVGVLRVLEELDLMKNIRRFVGASAGSVVAAYLAVGFDSYDIQHLFDPEFTPYIYDGSCGLLGRIYGLVQNLGAHPGNRLTTWLQNNIYEKTGNRDITFKQLYKERGVELCTVAVDLNLMDAVYFHVKTTPDMPIYLATRASTSIPAVLKPVSFNGDLFVDGGLLCNFPVHAYDGWFLSMDPKDSYFAQLGTLTEISDKWDPAERFGTHNEKTVGVLLFSTSERDTMKESLDKRVAEYSNEETSIPKTKLSKKKIKNDEDKAKSTESMKRALGHLMTILQNADENQSGTISRKEFRKALTENKDAFSADDVMVLFGCANDPDTIFDVMDTNRDEQIDYVEFVQHAAKRGVNLVQAMRGYERNEINGITDLLGSLISTLLLNVKRITTRGSDYSRTIGINTKYLDSFDWSMERADKNFLIQCGKQATLCFLREYIATKNPPRKSTQKIRVDGTASAPVKRPIHSLENQL